MVSPPANIAKSDSDSSTSLRLPTGGVTVANYHPLPGHVGNLTAAQLQTLDKLKDELNYQGIFVKERMDDAMLLRWLPPFFCLLHY
jgi:hypothetical protein